MRAARNTTTTLNTASGLGRRPDGQTIRPDLRREVVAGRGAGSSGRARLIAGPLARGQIDAGGVGIDRISADLLHLRDEGLLLGCSRVVLLLAIDERIGEDAPGAHVNDSPFLFAGERVDVLMAQEAEVLRVVQRVEVGRVAIELANEEIDGAGVLFAAIDEQLLFVALGFEGHARQRHVEHDGDGRRHGVDEKKGEAGAGVRFHAGFSVRGRVWVFLNCVSSIVMEVTPIVTTR